jgi:putative transposase
VRLAGITASPDSAWVTQQARNLVFGLRERNGPVAFLIRDRYTKFSGPFDEVFRTEGVKVIPTPIRAPRANAFAERFVRTVRAECLDHVLILGRGQLERVLRRYVTHYNRERPHRGIGLSMPEDLSIDRQPVGPRDVRRRDMLGGLIHEYYGLAA